MKIILLNTTEGKFFAQHQYIITYQIEGREDFISITLPPGIPTRDIIINAVIMQEYPSDKMQAVQNNYLLDPDDPDARASMDTMQEFRKAAKHFADELLNNIE